MHVLVLSSHVAMKINDNIYQEHIHSITTCIHMKPSASQFKTRAHAANTRPRTACLDIMVCVQWNLSMKDALNEGHFSNEDTVCSPNHIELCTNLPLN